MSTRGDVQISIYVDPPYVDDVLKGAAAQIEDLAREGTFNIERGQHVVCLRTDWMDVENNDANSLAWVETLIALPGVVGLELLNTPDVELYWRWTPALGMTHGWLIEGEDFIPVSDLYRFFSMSSAVADSFAAVRKFVEEAVGEPWRAVIHAYDRDIASQRALQSTKGCSCIGPSHSEGCPNKPSEPPQ